MNVKKIDFKDLGRDFKIIGKRCFIYDVEYILNECRVFRKKFVCDWKLFFREYNLCYRCCGLDIYMFKICCVDIRCEECESL